MAGGMHGQAVCVAGACLVGGKHGRGHVWQGDVCGRRMSVAGKTATTADGTHTTVMHSC